MATGYLRPAGFRFLGAGFGYALALATQVITLHRGLVGFLLSLPDVTSRIGNRIYFGRLPQRPTLPAIVYTVASDVIGRDLIGRDGTRLARVDFGLFGYDQLELTDLAYAIEQGFRSLNPQGIDGNMAGITVRWVRQEDQADLPEPEGLGGDRLKPFLAVEYLISYHDPLV